MDSPTSSSNLSAPPLMSASIRIRIPSSSSSPSSFLEPSLITPKHPEISSSSSSSSSSSDVNVCGDKDKVGRWSEQEHLVFLEGLHTYGKQWKTIAGMIGTRTVVQVRTHAQKYFQKCERNNDGTIVDFVLPPKAKPAGRQQAKRKSLPGSLPSRKKSRKTSSNRQSLSLGTRTSSASVLSVDPTSYEPPSYPSYISKSSSSSGSENWSTISPNAVVQLVDLNSQQQQYETAYTEADFDLLGEDPLEWLIETDSQQYLPESSLPLFPFLNEDKVLAAPQEDDFTHPQDDEPILHHNMVDPHVTMQESLFLPATPATTTINDMQF